MPTKSRRGRQNRGGARVAKKVQPQTQTVRPADAPRGLADSVSTLTDALSRLGSCGGKSGIFTDGIEYLHISIDPQTGRIDLTAQGPHYRVAEPLIARADDLKVGDKVPNKSEAATVGAATKIIVRDTPAYKKLVRNENGDIEFKDEEKTAADRMMTQTLSEKVNTLATLVKHEWGAIGVKLRITEAWDENEEHGKKSTHYEARAVDLTTHPVDQKKLGRLGRLAVEAGFGWVFYENELHVHASVST